MADQHKNFAYSTVLTAPSPATSGTSLVVQSGAGAKFPTPPFNATVWATGIQPDSIGAEIITVTVVTTDTFTIVRAKEGTIARTIVIGDQIACTITARTLTDVEGNRLSSDNVVLQPNFSLVVSSPYEIVDGTTIDILDAGILDII